MSNAQKTTSVTIMTFTVDDQREAARLRDAFKARHIDIGERPVSWIGGTLVLRAEAVRFVLEHAHQDLAPESFVWERLV